MRARTLRLVLLVIGLSALAAVACGEREKAARRGGTIVVGEISPYEGLNPMATTDAHARDIYQLLFLSLLDENPDFLTFSPRLAERWSFSEDRRFLTFHLRPGVSWSDGVSFSSRDVVETFRAQTDTALAWAGAHLKEHIDSVWAVDDLTVVYRFTRIYPYQLMDAVDGPILPAHVLAGMSRLDFRRLPVEELPVTGPFRVGEWVKGQFLTLVPNDSYYEEGKPLLEKVVIKIVPDQTTLLTQLRAGEIDVMEAVPPGEIDAIGKANPDLVVYAFPTRAYGYIGWNGAREPFDDRRVRRALTMAIDRQRIVDNLYYGHATICNSPFVPLVWAYDPSIEPVPFDPGGAVKLLAEADIEDVDGDGWLEWRGRPFVIELSTNYGNQIRMDTQVMVQEMLRLVGIRVEAAAIEWTVFLSRFKAGEYDGVVNSWRVGTKADLAPIWSCDARHGGYNRVDYCNPAVDSLNAIAAGMLDFEEARPLFSRVQRMIYDDQPYTFLYYGNATNVIHRRVRDARPDPISTYHNLHEWWVEGK
ncbi:MAG: hypothetical protein JW876_11085 [Candidatus Krumholzibacteriota bacterium]|nr:hypothetical protein [Candidatus Krumholzibacteriota bacterium]